jgi:hypothetical protein
MGSSDYNSSSCKLALLIAFEAHHMPRLGCSWGWPANCQALLSKGDTDKTGRPLVVEAAAGILYSASALLVGATAAVAGPR